MLLWKEKEKKRKIQNLKKKVNNKNLWWKNNFLDLKTS